MKIAGRKNKHPEKGQLLPDHAVPVLAITSFTAIRMGLDLDKGHKEMNRQGNIQREAVQKLSEFSFSVQQSHQQP